MQSYRLLCATALLLAMGGCTGADEVELDSETGIEETAASAPGLAAYNLAGFAQGTTGGGVLPETSPFYKKVHNAVELAAALKRGSGVKVVEIMNDLDIGWNELPAAAQTAPIAAHAEPKTHPVLKRTGVSKITVDGFDGLTIFSANGATIRHAAFTFKRVHNIIIRNIKFDELWEWDEASKGNYDKQDWDYLTFEQSHKVWVDHCEFGKAYDGLIDVKKAKGQPSDVTISWSVFAGDDGSPTGWVAQQINELERNKAAFPMYRFLRDEARLSTDDIIGVSLSQKKGHLIGATKLNSQDNGPLAVTLHHNYYHDVQDRTPRLRAGNAHVFNVVVDSSGAHAASARLANKQSVIASRGFHFGITSNAAISTEGGAVLVEKSHLIDVAHPMRNNQEDPDDTVFTGKIKALDSILAFEGTVFRGGSDNAESPLNPEPARAPAFSFNGFDRLPYTYTADAVDSVRSRVTGADGAGAGKLSWDKQNWLKTSY